MNDYVTLHSPLLHSGTTNNTVLSEGLEISAVVVGVIGSILNGLLFWVLSRNLSIDRKCCIIYQNLAAVDAFNCLVIPLCYVNLDGHGYNFDNDSSDAKNGILYLLFGAMVCIPYLLLILISLARVAIFRHRIFYTRTFTVTLIKVLCLLCWLVTIGLFVGVWLCYLLSHKNKSKNIHVLIGLLRFQGLAVPFLAALSMVLITVTVAFLQNMRNNISIENVGILCSLVLAKELKSAQIIFSLFLVSIFVWSSWPIVFSITFYACGPYYNTTSTFCKPFQTSVFSDPKSSYALILLCLSLLSISNSIILLVQRSFRITMKHMYNLIFKKRDSALVRETDEVIKQVIVSQAPSDIIPHSRNHLDVGNETDGESNTKRSPTDMLTPAVILSPLNSS